MEVVFINRNPKIGYSIHKVFLPIIDKMKSYIQVKSLDLTGSTGGISDVLKNCKAVFNAISTNKKDTVYHITGDVHYCTLPLIGKKVIVTVHDLGRYFNLKGIHKCLYWILRIFPLQFAQKVVCISNATVDEVNQAIHLPKDKITVIPDEVGDEFQYSEKAFNASRPTILHIGTRPHKNLTRTIKALKEIKCQLRIIGIVEDSDVKLMDENNIDYAIVQNLSDEELIQEYRNADIINFPSYHEGFGMPIIEGQAIGRLVITSDMEPMKSVAGYGAILCNPYDIDSIHEAYLKGINNCDYREKVIKAGLENVKKYRLDQITKQYLNLYKSL
mgnify:CR=1 FL=1